MGGGPIFQYAAHSLSQPEKETRYPHPTTKLLECNITYILLVGIYAAIWKSKGYSKKQF